MTEATETQEKKDVVPSQYRDKYKETGGTCGDFIATALQKISKDGIESLNAVKADNEIEADRWSSFNPGMQRMNLANVLRGRFLKGDTVIILGRHYNAKDMIDTEYGKNPPQDNQKSLLGVAKFLELQENDRTVASLQALLFPKAKGPTADERAATKALKDKEKDDAKAAKADAATKAKADKANAAAKAKADKANAAAKVKEDKASAAAKVKEDKASAAALAKSEAAEAKATKAAEDKAAKDRAKAAKADASAKAKADKPAKAA